MQAMTYHALHKDDREGVLEYMLEQAFILGYDFVGLTTNISPIIQTRKNKF